MKSLYIAKADHLEVDWILVKALTSTKFITRVIRELDSDWGNAVFSAKNYNGAIEIILKGSFGFDIFRYDKGEINHMHLTNSDIAEMHQSI